MKINKVVNCVADQLAKESLSMGTVCVIHNSIGFQRIY